jgi:O-antigen/teichoic acid export membrane protein
MLKKLLNDKSLISLLSYFFNTSFNSFIRIFYVFILSFFVSSTKFGESDLLVSFSTLLFSTLYFDQWVINFKDHLQNRMHFNDKLDLFFLSSLIYFLASILMSLLLNLNFSLLFFYGLSFVFNQYFFFYLRSLKLSLNLIYISLISNTAFIVFSYFLISFNFDSIYLILLPIIFYNFVFSFTSYLFIRKNFRINFIIRIKYIFKFWSQHAFLFFNSLFYWILMYFINFYFFRVFGSSELGVFSIVIKFSSIFAIVLSSFSLFIQEINFSNKYFNSNRIKFVLTLLFPFLVLSLPIFIFVFESLFLNEFSSGSVYLSFTLFVLLMQFLSSYFGSFNLSRGIFLPIFLSTFISGLLNLFLLYFLSNSINVITPLIINTISWTVNVLIRFFYANVYLKINFNFLDILLIIYSLFYYVVSSFFNDSLTYFVFLVFIVIVYIYKNVKILSKSS